MEIVLLVVKKDFRLALCAQSNFSARVYLKKRSAEQHKFPTQAMLKSTAKLEGNV
jgi:hypothetical protein